MPGESPTKWQAQAYRFGVRRLESAVSDGDALLRNDRRRRRLNVSIIVSIIVAALVLGAFTVYGFVNPAPKIGDASVVIDSDTGGVFVSRDGRLYPAMNLASALLAAGRGQSGNNPPTTTKVNTAAIGSEPRGPQLGIPGAPDVLPSASHLLAPRWTVCDVTTLNSALPPNSAPRLRTTALLGSRPPRIGSLGTTGAYFVTADNGATTYLIWNGTRSKINLSDDTIRLAFNLDSSEKARPMSPALLNLIPQAPNFTVPTVQGLGGQPSWAAALGVHVGDVFALKRADGTRAVYVAWADGVQAISPLLGDLIRDEYDVTKPVPLVPPRTLREAPLTAHPVDTSLYPVRPPDVIDYTDYAVACAYRVGSQSGHVGVFALRRLPVPKAGKPVSVTRPGPLVVDSVYLPPGRGAVLSAATSTQPTGSGPLYVVTDDGVAYPVVSPLALSYLGFAHAYRTAPELLALLPPGPTLDPDTAVRFYPQTGSSASALPAPSSSSSAAP